LIYFSCLVIRESNLDNSNKGGFMFKKAEKKKVYLKLGIQGPSGGGKTYGALSMATGFGGKIALIDTERGSSSLYADKFSFDMAHMEPPFTTEAYLDALNGAVAAKYEWLIIDSISHAWAGQGGLLEQKEAIDARGRGNSYTNWATITKKQNQFIEALMQAPINIICCFRSKTEYIMQDQNGKQVPKKVGLAAVQRDGFEYELDVLFELALDNSYEAEKDRTGLFKGRVGGKLTEKTGQVLKDWLHNSSNNQIPDKAKPLPFDAKDMTTIDNVGPVPLAKKPNDTRSQLVADFLKK
jgi:hypothetical protein